MQSLFCAQQEFHDSLIHLVFSHRLSPWSAIGWPICLKGSVLEQILSKKKNQSFDDFAFSIWQTLRPWRRTPFGDSQIPELWKISLPAFCFFHFHMIFLKYNIFDNFGFPAQALCKILCPALDHNEYTGKCVANFQSTRRNQVDCSQKLIASLDLFH